MPKRVDHTARRKGLADAALEAIELRGLDALRLVDVAKAAKATTGTVMHYLPSKDAVLEAAYEELGRRTNENLRNSRGEPVLDRAMAYLPHDAATERDWRVMLQFWGRAASDDRLKAIHKDIYDEQRAILAAEFTGIAGEEEAGLLADMAVSAVDGLSARIAMEPDSWPDARRRAVLTVLLRPLMDRIEALQARQPAD